MAELKTVQIPLYLSTLIAIAVFICQIIILTAKHHWQTITVDRTVDQGSIDVGVWEACWRDVNNSRSQCFKLEDFNKEYVKINREIYNSEVEIKRNFSMKQQWQDRCEDTQSHCDAITDPCDILNAPLVTGSVFANDSLFGHVHIHYTCLKGYKAQARYDNDVFCVCDKDNENCHWTRTPICIPDGKFH